MTRIEAINIVLENLDHNGSASGEQAASPALAKIIHAALNEEAEHAAKTGKPPLDHRAVCLGIMKNMRAAMTGLRDRLDSIDGVGIYK